MAAITTGDLVSIEHTLARPILEKAIMPWDALGNLKEFLLELCRNMSGDEYEEIKENVWVARDAKVFPTAWIEGPCIIGHGTEVRHCAFIRGTAIIGDGCVVGNSVEVKSSILFDEVKVPHYNYVGDSILGYRSHMGAGSITSNVKSTKTLVAVHAEGEVIETGRKKLGAILGDDVEVGCNSVLNPGTVIGPRSIVYPVSCVRGYIPKDSIYKSAGIIVHREA